MTTAGAKKWPRSWPPSPPPTTTSAPAATAASTWSTTFARCAGRDHRADVGRGVERIADHQRTGVVGERLEVVVVDVVENVEALGRGADLAGVQERSPGAALGRDLDLFGDVRADDERVLAAHLQVDAGDSLGADSGDSLAGSDRPGERDALDSLVGHDRGADVAGARRPR